MMHFAKKLPMMLEKEISLDQDIARPDSVSGVMLILLGTILLSILTVGNAFILNSVFGQFPLMWVAVILVVEIMLIIGVLFLWPNWRPTVRWCWPEVVGMMIVGGAFLAHALYLAPDDLMPVSFSVDCSHQHLLVNYIYQHNCFPDDVSYLYIYDDYPVAPSALAALLAHMLGVLPAQTMYPLGTLFVIAQVMVAFGISVELLPSSSTSYILAALAALMIFCVYSYSVDVFTKNFYSNMIMGDLIVLFVLWVIVVWKRLSLALITGVVIGLVFGVLNSYPAWLPFIFVPVIISMLRDQRMATRERWILAGFVLITTLVLTAIAIVDQWDFIIWFGPSRDYRLLPSWQSLGGIFLICACVGIWKLIRTWKQQRGLVLFLIIDIALVIILYGAAIMDKLSRYIPDKTFYFNIFLFVVLIAVGLDWVVAKLPLARKINVQVALATMMVLGVVAVALANARSSRPVAYPITLDEYRVAYTVAQEIPDIDMAYLVRTSTTFYWMYGAILNHTHDLTAQNERWQADMPTFERWIQDAQAPRRAIVSNLVSLPQDGTWRIVIRSGNSGLIEKVR